ncbi:hypothetical protein [Verminephrobacter eiseniae]|uniref:Type II secretion system protein GspC N-terminal domain-containing protein n=2 Tax=Verminephrobacter eiseniae TaxID=364317 RepID=A1WFQ4_VEREI|nr:hypothetical protein [Verminephrobacter eiseniae]ABM56461.1 hypothetical protein Veis_0679 [Verminephrobacter eiseniae EF01-2]MCW5286823.1 hypothetical protein [Verminephrobacter eiseniae]MCW5305120.1 hypothetical protein [Verminephrobacter eiseniae]MCW8178952.1 hypothetical protein [Verminephrobacter eiseniae]
MIKTHILRLLLAVNLLLACALAALWFTPARALRHLHWQPPAARAPQFSDPGSGLPARNPVLVSSFLVTLERPLFSPNRRPVPIAPVAAPADPLANIQLQGLYSAQGAGAGGIFARVDGKDRRIAVGSTLGDWTVKGIAGTEVTLARGADIQVLRLLPSRLGAVAPAPPASPAGAIMGGPVPPGAIPVGAKPPDLPSQLPSQVQDPVLRQEQERQEAERARLVLRNARRAAQGFPPVQE